MDTKQEEYQKDLGQKSFIFRYIIYGESEVFSNDGNFREVLSYRAEAYIMLKEHLCGLLSKTQRF